MSNIKPGWRLPNPPGDLLPCAYDCVMWYLGWTDGENVYGLWEYGDGYVGTKYPKIEWPFVDKYATAEDFREIGFEIFGVSY